MSLSHYRFSTVALELEGFFVGRQQWRKSKLLALPLVRTQSQTLQEFNKKQSKNQEYRRQKTSKGCFKNVDNYDDTIRERNQDLVEIKMIIDLGFSLFKTIVVRQVKYCLGCLYRYQGQICYKNLLIIKKKKKKKNNQKIKNIVDKKHQKVALKMQIIMTILFGNVIKTQLKLK
eukprot:TRINITY_DN9768_c0_g1_i1.p2 TRINITY_DN9768_c0_g1~~TRINITY_DN9768_c0_g1_i1.p2  ORF type:complete len:174 (-),score=4.32 TRINITY_DN9768_c0_g1_i1:139-660(-)